MNRVKLNPQGTVNITIPEEKVYSREDVESLLFNLAEHYEMTSAKGDIEDFNTWINKNL